jgi:predicted nucleotidyltransferase
MRLTSEQLKTIRETAAELIGLDARIWLFGSRADDQQRGGDIDLLVEVDRIVVDRVLMANRLAARLERRFQGLPVDVVLRDPATLAQPIHEIAKRTGVRL